MFQLAEEQNIHRLRGNQMAKPAKIIMIHSKYIAKFICPTPAPYSKFYFLQYCSITFVFEEDRLISRSAVSFLPLL